MSSLIQTTKQQYFPKTANNLSDPNISSLTYLFILESFLTGKKVPCISPIFHGNRFINDFREKDYLFKSHFADQYSLILTNYELFTDESLSPLQIVTLER